MDHLPPIPLLDLVPMYLVLPPQLRLLLAPVLVNPLDEAFPLVSVALLLVLVDRLLLVDLEASLLAAVSLEDLLRDSLDVVGHPEDLVSDLNVYFFSKRLANFLLAGFAPPPGFAPQGAPRKYSTQSTRLIDLSFTDLVYSGRIPTSTRIPASWPRARVPSARIWRKVIQSHSERLNFLHYDL